MQCPECGEDTKGRDHNGRGLRCTACWTKLPDVEDAKTPKPAPNVAVPEKTKAPPAKKPVRRRKAKSGGTS